MKSNYPTLIIAAVGFVVAGAANWQYNQTVAIGLLVLALAFLLMGIMGFRQSKEE